MSKRPEEIFGDIHRPDYWRRLAPGLSVAGTGMASDARLDLTVDEGRWPAGRKERLHGGYFEIPGLIDRRKAASLSRAIQAIRASALHPTFVYVYDETWEILEALLARSAVWLGEGLEALADAWAFFIDPRTDRGGWPIHRGWYEDVRGASGVPNLVNAWVSLTDADEHNACMHLVPLAQDPHYPDDLGNLEGLAARGQAIPTAAGDALVWDANTAHWGGSCDPSSDRPRVSVTFSIRRAGSELTGLPVVPDVRPSFADRLTLIAEQFLRYGPIALDPAGPEMRWAAMIDGMRGAIDRSRER